MTHDFYNKKMASYKEEKKELDERYEDVLRFHGYFEDDKKEALDLLEELAQLSVSHSNCEFLQSFRKEHNLGTERNETRCLKLIAKYELSYKIFLKIDSFSLETTLRF